MKYIIALIAIVVFVSFASSCANIIPPSGGPRDTLPPHLIASLPKDSALNVNAKSITLTFDEFVEIKNVQENLIFSPIPKNLPNVDYKLRNITIKLRDSLEPNTTYSLNFGDAIKDINEGNPARNFTYVFSTGNTLANGTFSGKVVLAETGKLDTTLVVVLHKNLNDTAVMKDRPRYFAKLDGKGAFRFRFVQPGQYAAFVVPNDFTKKYDDSTKLFAFLNNKVAIADTTSPATFYAFQEQKKKAGTPPPPGSGDVGAPAPPATTTGKPSKEDKRLKMGAALDNGQQDLLNNSIKINFSRKIFSFDSSKILLTDTFNRPLPNVKAALDTGRRFATLTYGNAWRSETFYRLIIFKDAVADTANVTLSKGDTIQFTTKKESDYGSLRLRFANLDVKRNPVLQFANGDKIVVSAAMNGREFNRKLFIPGEYEVSILYDTNKNGQWDAGSYAKKIQPEIVFAVPQKLTVRANADNDIDNIVVE